MIDASPERTRFATVFRARLFQYVEYSCGSDPDQLGTMIAGDADFLHELATYLRPLDFAATWHGAVRAFCDKVRPVSYLFKVDWHGERIQALSLYCRFVENVTAETVYEAFQQATPLSWSGPDLEAIGRAVGTHWPHGIGLRVSPSGGLHSAVYYRISMPGLQFRLRAIPELIAVCAFPEARTRDLQRAVARVYGPGPVGVVAVDAGADRTAAAIKLDAERVPLQWAMRFIADTGEPVERLHSLQALTVRLGIRQLSYFGMKFGRDGFAGWKAYLPFQPRLVGPALAPRMDVNQWSASAHA